MGARDWWRVAPAVAALAWGGNHFAPLLLLYRERLGYSQVEVDLLLAVYIVGIVPGFLVTGPLSDRFGRKRPLVAGVVLGCAGSAILAASASSLPLLAAGRFVSGLSVAAAMVAGTAWIKELSARSGRAAAPVAARRAALTLTAGFGAGPAVSGTIAQWGPAPTVLPYAIHVAVVLAACAPLATAVETRAAGRAAGSGRVPAAVRGRFTAVLLPAAPWVFGSAAVSFAVVPALATAATGSLSIAYATAVTVLGLVCGALVQPFAARLGVATGGRELPLGLAVVAAGVLLAALVAATGSPLLGVPAAMLLGAGYGLCLVSGLTEVQRIAPPEHLGRLTAVYYGLTYLGFAFPAALAALAGVAPEPLLLVALATACAVCLVLCLRGLRRPT